MVHQSTEEGADRREGMDAVGRERLQHSRDVARIGNQNRFTAQAQAQHHADGERENMVQRQRAHAGWLLARRDAAHGRQIPGFGLQHIRNQVPV